MAMIGNRKIVRWTLTVLGLVGVLAAGIFGFRLYKRHRQPFVVTGAVIKLDADPRKQSPIANVVVSAPGGYAPKPTNSGFSGGFVLPLRQGVRIGHTIQLTFRHPDFEPLDLTETLSNKLLVVKMKPLHSETASASDQNQTKITHVLLRYTTERMTTENIGSALKTFQVVNTANVPCNNHPPCSRDERWKAQVGSESMDAGNGNVFRDARVTCIAGPCAFTRIDVDGFSHGGRKINVTVRDWSDTTTFLFQAEVFRSQLNSMVQQTYPIIFGRALNFTLPSSAEGPSIEADLNGTMIVFPLGPQAILSWASCQVQTPKNQGKNYRCELKTGYTFE
jgi:hypothetical protein